MGTHGSSGRAREVVRLVYGHSNLSTLHPTPAANAEEDKCDRLASPIRNSGGSGGSHAAHDLGVVDLVKVVEHQNILLLGQELLDRAFYLR